MISLAFLKTDSWEQLCIWSRYNIKYSPLKYEDLEIYFSIQILSWCCFCAYIVVCEWICSVIFFKLDTVKYMTIMFSEMISGLYFSMLTVAQISLSTSDRPSCQALLYSF